MRVATVEIVAIKGQDTVARWRAPVPLDMAVGKAPTLTVKHPTLGDVAVSLAQVHADVTINAVGNGRKSLTATAAVADLDGVAGLDGAAFLLPTGGKHFDCVVDEAQGTTIKLAAPLANKPTVSAANTATLQFATFTGTIEGGAGKVAETVGSYRANVVFFELLGSDGVSTRREIAGVLRVQDPPWFGTGLSSASIVGVLPNLRQVNAPRGQGGWALQIEAGLRDLVARVSECRPDLDRGVGIAGGELLHDVHARLTGALIYDEQKPEYAARLRQLATDELRRVCDDLESLGTSDAIDAGPGKKYTDVGVEYAADPDTHFNYGSDRRAR